MSPPNASVEERTLRERIVGQVLSSVEFVQDYVQFRFDGPTLTCLSRPTVELDGRTFPWGRPGFRDALCERITREVRSASIVKGGSVRIELDDSAVITIPLRAEGLEGREAVIFTADGQAWWVLHYSGDA